MSVTKLKWSVHAGGTFAAEGKYGYTAHPIIGSYHIDPVSYESGKHKGYHLRFTNDKGVLLGGLWQDLGMFRSPNEAKGKAVAHYKEHKDDRKEKFEDGMTFKGDTA